MGTNFYGTRLDTQEECHIGKRSAAGLYCWDCHQTLCLDGEASIHSGHSDWSPRCPKCGRSETPHDNTTGWLELGFGKPFIPEERVGVKTCSSFTWGIDKGALELVTDIRDEYGHKYTMQRFLSEVLENCPVQFFEYINVEGWT